MALRVAKLHAMEAAHEEAGRCLSSAGVGAVPVGKGKGSRCVLSRVCSKVPGCDGIHSGARQASAWVESALLITEEQKMLVPRHTAAKQPSKIECQSFADLAESARLWIMRWFAQE